MTQKEEIEYYIIVLKKFKLLEEGIKLFLTLEYTPHKFPMGYGTKYKIKNDKAAQKYKEFLQINLQIEHNSNQNANGFIVIYGIKYDVSKSSSGKESLQKR